MAASNTFFNVIPPRSPKKTRSEIVIDHLSDFPFISLDRKNFKHYAILTHETKDFSKPIVSIGAPPSRLREILTFNPDDQEIINIYNSLISNKKEITLNNLTLFIFELLTKPISKNLINTVNALLEKWLLEHENDADTFITTLNTGIKVPIVPIQFFIQNHAYFCRHYSLLTCFLLFKLVQDNKLSGEIFHHRDSVVTPRNPNGAHSFAVFKTFMFGSEEIYIIDALNSKIPLELHRDRDTLIKMFGEQAVTNIGHRYWSAPQPAVFIKQ